MSVRKVNLNKTHLVKLKQNLNKIINNGIRESKS